MLEMGVYSSIEGMNTAKVLAKLLIIGFPRL